MGEIRDDVIIEVHETQGVSSLIEVVTPPADAPMVAVTLTLDDAGEFATRPPLESVCRAEGLQRMECDVASGDSIFLAVHNLRAAPGVDGGQVCAIDPEGTQVCVPVVQGVPLPAVELEPLLASGVGLLVLAVAGFRRALRNADGR